MYHERVCEGDGNAGDGGGVIVVSAGHVGGTCGSGIVSSAADELGMSAERGMRGVCKMCMCLIRGGVRGEGGGEWMRGLGFTNYVETRGVLDVCLYLGCGVVGGAGGESIGGLDQSLEGWCGIMYV